MIHALKQPLVWLTAGAFWRRAIVLWLGLFGVAACTSTPQFGMESPGRPEITWSGPVPEPRAPGAPESKSQTPSKPPANDELRRAENYFALAMDRRRHGELFEAAQLYRQALEIRERVEGPNDPDVAAVLNNLGGVEAAQGHYDTARPLIERALAIRQTALGPEHVLTAESASNLALLLAAEGKVAAAESLYQRALAILEKKTGAEQAPLDVLLDNYAALLHDTGRDAQADELEARARLLRATAEQGSDPAK